MVTQFTCGCGNKFRVTFDGNETTIEAITPFIHYQDEDSVEIIEKVEKESNANSEKES